MPDYTCSRESFIEAVNNFFDAAELAGKRCIRRTQGDGTMHVARKMLTDAIDEFDRAIRG